LTNKTYWTSGFTDESTPKEFVWCPGSVIEASAESLQWKGGSPGNKEGCFNLWMPHVTQEQKSNASSMNDTVKSVKDYSPLFEISDCDNKFNFICEVLFKFL
jgi:hypothetical protein